MNPTNQTNSDEQKTPVPGAPSVTATQSAVSGTTGSPRSPKTKKAILIGGIIAGALVLAIIGVVVFLALTSVSKQDYQDAAKQFNQVSLASSGLIPDVKSLGVSTGSGNDAAFEENLKETEGSLEKIKTENEALSKLKAVQVGEGANLYKTFDEKLDAYLTYGTGIVASVKNLRPAMVVCEKISAASEAAARVATLKECAAAFDAVKDIPDASFKAYITTLKDAYKEYATTYEGINALSNPYGAQYEQYKPLRDKMYDVQDKITDATKAFTNSLNESDDKYSINESADALAAYLNDQQR